MVESNSFCKKWPKFCWPQFLQFVLSTLLMQQLLATLIMELLVQKSFKQGMMEQLGIILVQDINLLGLHYTRLPTIFYLYYAALLFILTSFSRYGGWLRKDSSFSIFVLFGLIEMDWCSLICCQVLRLLKFSHGKSGGEKARTVFARAIIMRPRLILCDEPTASLDIDNKRK